MPVDRWHDIVGKPTLAAAILDRFIHNAHRIELLDQVDAPVTSYTADGTYGEPGLLPTKQGCSAIRDGAQHPERAKVQTK